jgi:hypothetical protein
MLNFFFRFARQTPVARLGPETDQRPLDQEPRVPLAFLAHIHDVLGERRACSFGISIQVDGDEALAVLAQAPKSRLSGHQAQVAGPRLTAAKKPLRR